jgi:FAD:protein FMN transferase
MVDAVTVRCQRPAMATRFVFLLVGEDRDHLMAVGEAALDEVTRVERLLSRHDPASEVARINREASSHPVRIDRELFAILTECRSWFDRTQGYFDVCATSLHGSPRSGDPFDLDSKRMTIRFVDPLVRLDFGGYGKGYAIDAASRVLDEFGVESALLNGGTSSILVRGRQEDGSNWRVGLRDPFGEESDPCLIPMELTDCGVSSSAVFDPDSIKSNIIDPILSRTLDRQAACSVIAPTALEAEVLSTALLAMGRARAATFLVSFPGIKAVWIGRDGDRVEVEWLGAGGIS